MVCDFTSFSAIFQSYQDDGTVIMKSYLQLNLVHGLERFPPPAGLERGIAK